ncbi:unnamed protein product [Leptosia nina]|uniref:Uncharacterized protein n=1 Tax=Leptosia nina TaxID=320188 RepID=A0AAV1JEK0_9NEOP
MDAQTGRCARGKDAPSSGTGTGRVTEVARDTNPTADITIFGDRDNACARASNTRPRAPPATILYTLNTLQ